jgi:hypothetical protein
MGVAGEREASDDAAHGAIGGRRCSRRGRRGWAPCPGPGRRAALSSRRRPASLAA